MNDNERYLNKPFLRLLELYVLWAIYRLPEDQESLLLAMTPKLQKTYGLLVNGMSLLLSKWRFLMTLREQF